MIHSFFVRSLSKSYFVFAFIMLTLMLVISLVVGTNIYHSKIEERHRRLQEASSKVDSALSDSMDYIIYLMEFLRRQISLHGGNLEYVNSLYSGFKEDLKVKDLSSWSMFDWLSEDKQIRLTSAHGILKEPVDLSDRPNLKLAFNSPGKVFFNDPSLGKISQQWILPISCAVPDKAHPERIVGGINIGVAIPALTAKIEQNLSDKHVHFILLTESSKILLESSSNKPQLEREFFYKKFASENMTLAKFVAAKHSINGITYRYFRKSTKYPFYILVGHDAALEDKTIIKEVVKALLPLIGIGLVSIVILFIFQRHILSPIIRLSESAHRLSEGEVDVVLPKVTGEEAEHLAIALGKVKAAQDMLRSVNAVLEEKVKERTIELEGALSAKDEFLRNISHEIRLPISCIQALSELLHEDWDTMADDKKRYSAQEIYANIRRLYELVQNLLDLSKMQVGKMAYQMESHDMRVLCEQVMQEVKGLCEQKHLQLALTLMPDTVATIRCDAVRIGQVIRNLLSNAIKFTKEGTITMTLSNETFQLLDGRKQKGLKLAVKDEGVGVPSNELLAIFDAFTQSSRTRTNAGGTGLGLNICQKIIDAHGGIIWAENNQGEPGATFVFILPNAQ